MKDETSSGSSGASDERGHRRAGGAECPPLQTRAAFLKNWSWESVVGINQRACARSGSQHGINSETGVSCQSLWQKNHPGEITLLEAFDLLRKLHRSAPFLYLNANTFSFIDRELCPHPRGWPRRPASRGLNAQPDRPARKPSSAGSRLRLLFSLLNRTS